MDLSIIVPVFNTEIYLQECLESLMSLELINYEIIAINDGLTDGSGELLEEYAQHYDQIRVYHHENKGAGAARNFGMSVAKGEYLYFVDSDDYLNTKEFAKVFHLLKQEQAECVFFQWERLLQGMEQPAKQDKENFVTRKTEFFQTGEELLTNLHQTNRYSVSPCLSIIKRSVLKDYGIWFPEGIKREDEVYYFQMLLSVGQCIYIPKKVYLRRVRPGSIMTATNCDEFHISHLVVLEKLIKTYHNHQFRNAQSKRVAFKRVRTFYLSALANASECQPTEIKIQELKAIWEKLNQFDVRSTFAGWDIHRYQLITQSMKQVLERLGR